MEARRFIFPQSGQVVPVNTKIYIFDGAETISKSSLIKLSADGKAVAFRAEEFSSDGLHGWVLTPKKPLRANSEITLTVGKLLLYSFFTSKETDSAAPSLSELKATPEKSPPATGMCSSGRSYVQLALKSSTEKIELKKPPSTGEVTIVKVWVDEAGKAIDFKKPPTFYEIAHNQKLQIGEHNICEVSNYDFDALSGKTIKVGVAVQDLAGNTSATLEESVTIK